PCRPAQYVVVSTLSQISRVRRPVRARLAPSLVVWPESGLGAGATRARQLRSVPPQHHRTADQRSLRRSSISLERPAEATERSTLARSIRRHNNRLQCDISGRTSGRIRETRRAFHARSASPTQRVAGHHRSRTYLRYDGGRTDVCDQPRLVQATICARHFFRAGSHSGFRFARRNASRNYLPRVVQKGVDDSHSVLRTIVLAALDSAATFETRFANTRTTRSSPSRSGERARVGGDDRLDGLALVRHRPGESSRDARISPERRISRNDFRARLVAGRFTRADTGRRCRRVPRSYRDRIVISRSEERDCGRPLDRSAP